MVVIMVMIVVTGAVVEVIFDGGIEAQQQIGANRVAVVAPYRQDLDRAWQLLG